VQQRQQRGLSLSFRWRTQNGVEPLQPRVVCADPLDRVIGFDQPVDVLVESDAVVVGFMTWLRLKSVHHLLAEGRYRLGDDIDK
jgi:hypothetical protein